MRKISKTLMIACGALAVLGFALSAPNAQARPLYLKQFAKKYPAVSNAAKMKKCLVCHPGKNRKMRNNYGQAVAAGLGKNAKGQQNKNVKNAKQIDAALTKAEAAKSKKSGKTFGEMIEEGNLPE
jgi:hypothetical protein